MGYERLIQRTVMPARTQSPVGVQPFQDYRFADGTVWTEFYRSGGGYLLRFPGFVDFEVSADGKKIFIYPTDGCDEGTMEHLYVNQLVPLALSRQGQPAFHASVVTVTGGAVAFLGQSGMGKSTLAAFFALNGEAFVADDSLIVGMASSGCYAIPSHASLRLWEDSLEAVVGEHSEKAENISYSSKARLLAGEGLAYCNEPQSLLAAFQLCDDGSSEITIKATEGSQRVVDWIEHSFLLDVEDKELLGRHFEWTHKIAEDVPTFRLDYPRNYDILPEVKRAIRTELSGV